MKIKFLFILGFMLILCNLTRSQNPGDVSINEIMHEPALNINEWFENYNNTATPISLANWKWKDAAVSL